MSRSGITFREDLKFYGKYATKGIDYVAGQIEVTSNCFQRCAFCESWRDDALRKEKGHWTGLQLRHVCKQLAATKTFEHLSLTGGDPLIWSPLCGFLKTFEYEMKHPFALQVSTALMVDPCTIAGNSLWHLAVNDFRVSLDAIKPATYGKLRGTELDPKIILERMEKFQHPGLSTNTTVCWENIDEMPELIDALVNLKCPLRKALFLPVLGDRATKTKEHYVEFWKKYNKLGEYAESVGLLTSFAESVPLVRSFLLTPEAKEIRCWAGKISFHAKANGDVYPCCLVGGEAIETINKYKIGNCYTDFMSEILERYKAERHYGKDTICSKICQWKQLQINMAGEIASGIVLSMP